MPWVNNRGPRGLEVTTELDMFPTPLTYAIDRAFARFRLPVAQGEELQDFGLSIDFAGLRLPDELWSMIDPEATLPRDPANLAVGAGRPAKAAADPHEIAEDLQCEMCSFVKCLDQCLLHSLWVKKAVSNGDHRQLQPAAQGLD